MGNKLDYDEKKDYVGRNYVHYCQLPREVEVISFFIPNEQRFRQWFRKLCVISSNVSHRKLYLKSFRALEQDRAIHLSQHYYIIHPFSAFRYYWEIFMIVMFLMQIIISPIILMKAENFFPVGIWVMEVFQLIAFSNMIVQFMSGYFEKSSKTIILEPKTIIIFGPLFVKINNDNFYRHYLKTFFIWDFIANIPVEIFFYFKDEGLHYITVRAIMMKVQLNIISFMDYTEKIRDKRQYPLCRFRLFQFIFIYISGMIWITFLLRIAIHLDQGDMFTQDIMWSILNNVFVLMFCLGQTDFILHGIEIYVHFIAITFGFIMRNIIIAQVILLFKSYYSSKRKYTQLLAELKEFSYFKRLPKNIKEIIFNYYNFLFQHYYYNEREIWNLMSDKLKYEIDKSLYKIWFEADIFVLCPPQLMQSLVLLLKREIYLANDVIYACNTKANYIYFLKHGTVAQYDEKEKELFHVQQGSFFSESALILDTEIVYESTAIAIEACEIYKLHREDFREIIQHFPDEYKNILKILKQRVHIVDDTMSAFDSNKYYAGNESTDESDDEEKKN